jgi:hypothetical protein
VSLKTEHSLNLCYSWDLECPLRLGPQSVALLGGGGIFRRFLWKDVRPQVMSPWRGYWGTGLLLTLCFSATMRWTGILHHRLPPRCMVSPHAQDSRDHALKCLKPWIKINLSSLKVYYLRYFVTVTESWLTHSLAHQSYSWDLSSCAHKKLVHNYW